MSDKESILETAIDHAEKNIKADCIFCRVGNQQPVMVFSASPVFLCNGRWYHLHLHDPRPNAKGGYNWKECEAAVHHEYLSILTDTKPLTWQEAADNVRALEDMR